MSLGLLVLVLWIYPKINRLSVWLSILFCLMGVIVPAILFGISEQLVMWAFAACLCGVLAMDDCSADQKNQRSCEEVADIIFTLAIKTKWEQTFGFAPISLISTHSHQSVPSYSYYGRPNPISPEGFVNR